MKLLRGLIVSAALSLSALLPAKADYIVRDGNGQPIVIKSFIVGGGVLSMSAPVDSSGNAYSSSNPLSVQFPTAQHVICDSGCSGGGGGGGAVFGPTAVGTAAANPPVLIGGTVDGTATGAMSAWKVSAGIGFINCANCSGSGISVSFAGAIGTVGTPGGFKDGSGNFQPLLGDVTNGQWVNVKASVLPTGAATQTTLASILSALGTPFQAGGSIANTSFASTQSGTWNITNISGTVSLPTGAATSAAQTTGNSSLSSIDGKTPALGQALAAASVPVVLTAAQIATLTPLSSVGISGTLPAFAATPTFNLGTLNGAATATNQTGGSQKTQIVDGSGNVIASTSNNLNVQCANCSGSGVSTGDEAAFTAGSSLFAGGGGFFQTTATSNPLTSGQQGMFQVTANRALFTNLRNASGTEIGTSTTPVQVSLANTATNATAVKVDGSGVTQPVSGSVSISGTASVNPGTAANWGIGATGAAVPANAVYLGITSGGNLTGWNGAVTNAGTFAVQAAQSGTWNVTNISGTVSLPTGASTAANQPSNAAQASTTSGQTGNLMMGAATTAAPSYTTAQTNPLSLTLAGALRVDASATTQPVSGTVTASQGTAANLNATVVGTGTFATQPASATAPVSTMNSASAASGLNAAIAGVFDDVSPTAITENSFGFLRMSANRNAYTTIRDAAGNERGVNVDASNRLTTAPTLISGAVNSGAIASGAFASGAVASGAYASGSLASGAVVDLTNLSTPITPTTATATKGLLLGAQYNSTQATFTNGQQGSLQISSRGALYVATGADTFTATANQGTANTLANAWSIKITDATNGPAAVKAASTAAVATDPSLVVAESPNSPLVPFAAYSIASITRSANTTTYTVNTGWNNGTPTFFSFTSACRVNGGQVYIPRIDIWSSANPTLKLTGVLYLFSAVPGTNVSDNATFTIASADFANLTGNFAGFPFALGNNQASGASNSSVSLIGTTYQAQCASGSTTITGMVQVSNAYVPANAEVLHIGLATSGAN